MRNINRYFIYLSIKAINQIVKSSELWNKSLIKKTEDKINKINLEFYTIFCKNLLFEIICNIKNDPPSTIKKLKTYTSKLLINETKVSYPLTRLNFLHIKIFTKL